MLTNLTWCRTSTNKTCVIRGRASFGRQKHNLNKLGRGSQDDATNIISMLYDKKIFFMFLPHGHYFIELVWKWRINPLYSENPWKGCLVDCCISSGSALFAMINALFIEWSTHLLGKSTCDTLKRIIDNHILIVAICMGNSIFPESRENSLQTRQPHLQNLSPLQNWT